VLPEGYGVTMTLNDVVIRERIDSMPWQVKTYYPWVDVPIRFLMTETGKRVRLRATPKRPGSMPGAVFQPLLFPHFGPVDSIAPGEGDVFDRSMYLLDNIYPPVQWNGGFLRKGGSYLDTTGVRILGIQLSETGQVWHIPGANSDDDVDSARMLGVKTHAVLNGGGTYWFDASRGMPIGGEYQMIANLTLTDQKSGKERKGRQLIFTQYREADSLGSVDELFGDH
jgi:hypothetical protein